VLEKIERLLDIKGPENFGNIYKVQLFLFFMKKLLGGFVFGLFLISMFGFVSSGPGLDSAVGEIQGVGKSIFEVFRPLLEGIVGETVNGETFLAKILFLVIIFSIIWVSLEKVSFFRENTWTLVTVGAAASILAIRWFGSSEIVQTAILPYSVLGIAISSGIPFVLFYFIVADLTKVMRKVSWIFFSVVFVGLWFSRYEDLGNFGYIYLITAGLGLAMLAFDGTLQKIKNKARTQRIRSATNSKLIDRLHDDLGDADKRFSEGTIDSKEHKSRLNNINERLDTLT
jgi:hypothetical protein